MFVSAQADGGTKYVGYTYKGVVPEATLPNGVKHLGGALIGDIDTDPVYGISQVEIGKTKMLWLEISTGQNASGVTGWKVLDVLSFSSLSSRDHLFFYGAPAIDCRRNGGEIENLVGFGRIDRKRSKFNPTKLWIANLKTKRFETISTLKVTCLYSEP